MPEGTLAEASYDNGSQNFVKGAQYNSENILQQADIVELLSEDLLLGAKEILSDKKKVKEGTAPCKVE